MAKSWYDKHWTGTSYLAVLLLVLIVQAAQAADEPRYDSDKLTVHLSPRTPQQIAAFYAARGFGEAMVDKLRQQCFITVFIKNKSQQIIWLDLTQWQFHNPNGVVQRLDRNYWKAVWRQMQIPLAHQSTFRWTLLPEQLDFQPEEREGGNIILPRDKLPITIRARFATGKDRAGKPIIVKLDQIQCAENP